VDAAFDHSVDAEAEFAARFHGGVKGAIFSEDAGVVEANDAVGVKLLLRSGDIVFFLRCCCGREECEDEIHCVVAEDAGRGDGTSGRGDGGGVEKGEDGGRDPEAVYVDAVEEDVKIAWEVCSGWHTGGEEGLVPPCALDPVFLCSGTGVQASVGVNALVHLCAR